MTAFLAKFDTLTRHHWDALSLTGNPDQPCIDCGKPGSDPIHWKNPCHLAVQKLDEK